MKYDLIIGGCHIKSHEQQNNDKKKCQDYHYIRSKKSDGFYSFAVADGAGSAYHSEIGAKLVSEKICQLLEANFDSFYDNDPIVIKKKIIRSLRICLGKEAKKMKSSIDEFASTLLFVAIKKNKIIVGHIGDGLIAYTKNQILQILSFPENGEFLNLTYFVTSKYYLHHLRLYKGTLDGIQSIFLMTDGFANIFYSRKHKKLLDEVKELLKKLKNKNSQALTESITELLIENISQRTNDDSTLVAAYLSSS